MPRTFERLVTGVIEDVGNVLDMHLTGRELVGGPLEIVPAVLGAHLVVKVGEPELKLHLVLSAPEVFAELEEIIAGQNAVALEGREDARHVGVLVVDPLAGWLTPAMTLTSAEPVLSVVLLYYLSGFHTSALAPLT